MAFQDFLERNPAFLPGMFADYAGHGAFLDAAISQPRLQGVELLTPDFMFIAGHTLELRPVLIEIEDPAKRWATRAQRPQQHSDLAAPLRQLDEWREWLGNSAQREVFLDSFEIPDVWCRRPEFEPVYALVHGRSSEGAAVNTIRNRLRNPRRLMFTYDHLRPDNRLQHYLTVRRVPGGGFRVMHVMPTARLTPSRHEDWKRLIGLREAVASNPHITDARKEYLYGMIERWDSWADDSEAWYAEFHARYK